MKNDTIFIDISKMCILRLLYLNMYCIIYYLSLKIEDYIAMASGRKCVVCIYPCINQSSGKCEDLLFKTENKFLIDLRLTELRCINTIDT